MIGFWIQQQLQRHAQPDDGDEWLPPERTRALLRALYRQVDPVTRRNWKEPDLHHWWVGILEKYPELMRTKARDLDWAREAILQDDTGARGPRLPAWITSDRWLREMSFGEAAAMHVAITFLAGIVIIVVLALSL